MAAFTEKLKPFLVMNRLIVASSLGEHIDGDLLKPLSSKTNVSVIKAKLWPFSQGRLYFPQHPVVVGNPLLYPVYHGAQSFKLLPLLLESPNQPQALSAKDVERILCHLQNVKRSWDGVRSSKDRKVLDLQLLIA
jgi:hypothetical protein